MSSQDEEIELKKKIRSSTEVHITTLKRCLTKVQAMNWQELPKGISNLKEYLLLLEDSNRYFTDMEEDHVI